MDIFTHRGKNIEKERKSKQKLLMTAFLQRNKISVALICLFTMVFFNSLGVRLSPTYAQISLQGFNSNIPTSIPVLFIGDSSLGITYTSSSPNDTKNPLGDTFLKRKLEGSPY